MQKRETRKAGPSTSSGKESGKAERLRLPDLPEVKLGPSSEHNAFHAPDEEFLGFIRTLVPLEGENLDHWTWEERRDFLNWCLDGGILELKDGLPEPSPDETAQP